MAEDTTKKLINVIETLADKANDSGDSGDALRFTQAALNAAHAISVLDVVERSQKE